MNKIDFVIPWVDGNDENWLAERNKYKKDKNNNTVRYRDMGTLKYWFRGVAECAPWVNKIHFVTWGHVPSWLDISNPKINIVKHEDFIPKEYLPTFSSHTIELNLHRIKGLSERFVYFNDDTFILNKLEENYYFKNGLPCDFWKENVIKLETNDNNFIDHIVINNLNKINKNFNKNTILKKKFKKIFNIKYGKRNIRYLMLLRWKYFCGFDCPHLPVAYLKTTFEEVWEKEYKKLNETCLNKFRTMTDVNQWLLYWWQTISTDFSVISHKNIGRYYNLSENNKNLFEYIRSKKSTIVCINDTEDIDFEQAQKELIEIFNEKFPNKSEFEL